METFVQSQVEDGEHGEENLDSEFIFGEFLEASMLMRVNVISVSTNKMLVKTMCVLAACRQWRGALT